MNWFEAKEVVNENITILVDFLITLFGAEMELKWSLEEAPHIHSMRTALKKTVSPSIGAPAAHLRLRPATMARTRRLGTTILIFLLSIFAFGAFAPVFAPLPSISSPSSLSKSVSLLEIMRDWDYFSFEREIFRLWNYALIYLKKFWVNCCGNLWKRAVDDIWQSDGDRKFEIADDMFWKDGRPFRIIGGDVHYFRTLPEVFLESLGLCIVLRKGLLITSVIKGSYFWRIFEMNKF